MTHVCGMLVGCLTYHRLITGLHLWEIVYMIFGTWALAFTSLASYVIFYKFRFLTRLRVTGGGFIILANTDNHEAIQVHAKQPLTEGLSRYKLSRDSYYIRG